MRAIFVGTSPVTIMTARQLLGAGHDVVIIEEDDRRIEALGEELDCGFVHGDGSRPAVLEELSPGGDDVLLCLSNDDQNNIIASLVGQTMKFGRIITRIEDPDYQVICAKLGLNDVIVPDRDVAERLAETVEGHDAGQLSVAVEGGIRFFHFIVPPRMAGRIDALDLPGESRVIVVTRDGESRIVGEDAEIRADDRLLIMTYKRDMQSLQQHLAESSDQ